MAGFSARKGRNFGPAPNQINEVSGKDRDFHTIENAPGPGVMATGGIIVEPGDGYVYHVFTGDENFEPLVPSNQLKYVEYMLIGGGGGGGGGAGDPGDMSGGGGGGGGFVRGYASVTAGNTYPLVIGAGGQYSNAYPPYVACGTLGSPTSGFGQVAIGGGGGNASTPLTYSNSNRLLGGSGGGGGFDYPTTGGGDAGNNADFDNPLSPEKGWQGHRGGESDTTAPSTYASPPYTVNYQDEFAGAGGGAGGRATKPPISFFPTNATNAAYRLNAEYTRGPGKQLDEFSVANIGPAYPTHVAGRLASPEINGWGAGGGSNTTLEPHLNRAQDTPANKSFRAPVGANTGGGGHGMPGVSPTYASQYMDPSAYGDSGVAVVRYKKNESGSLAARATGGNVVEPGNTADHFGVVRHIFTGPGTFTVTDSTLTSVRYLAVGGGGSGGNAPFPASTPDPNRNYAAGGGGAGGFVTSETGPMTSEGEHSFGNFDTPAKLGKPYVVSSTETGGYPIVVGGGGPAEPGPGNPGRPGGDTTIGAPGPEQIIAFGGGGGAGRYTNPQGYTQNGQSGDWMEGIPGGSGGGGACRYGYTSSTTIAYGGEAKTAGTGDEYSQGNPGYQGAHGYSPSLYGGAGGGGGAGGNHLGGQALKTAYSYHGGWGMWSPLAPPNYGTPGPEPGKRYFAGGGGGAAYSGYINPTDGGVVPENFQPEPTGYFFPTFAYGYPQGGYGGGGLGAPVYVTDRNATTNTGGGGGGTFGVPSNLSCSVGGSGIVIIEYPA